jgi:GT2 family glycosyltransferase
MKTLVVSIIIVTRNRPFLLQHAIKRVLAQSYPNKELIVVDSSSNNESEQVIAEYPEVRYVHLHGQSNNMPQARNKGLTIASGEILAFIDDDSMVQPGWLDALIDTYQDETVGAAGGRIIRAAEPYCNQVTGSPRLLIKASGDVIATGLEAVSTHQVEVEHLRGCNMSFRRKAVEQVGGFDSSYTLTNTLEDTDFCLRVKKAGWCIMFNPAMAVVHYSARGSQKPSMFNARPLFQLSVGRNSAYFTFKHFGLNIETLTTQLMLYPLRSWGRALTRCGLHIVAALALNVGRIIGLIAAIHWLLSSRRRAESAPKIW